MAAIFPYAFNSWISSLHVCEFCVPLDSKTAKINANKGSRATMLSSSLRYPDPRLP